MSKSTSNYPRTKIAASDCQLLRAWLRIMRAVIEPAHCTPAVLVACSDCEGSIEANSFIPCGCVARLCEACYDRAHEDHGLNTEGCE